MIIKFYITKIIQSALHYTLRFNTIIGESEDGLWRSKENVEDVRARKSVAQTEETARRTFSVKEDAVKRAGSEDQRIDYIVHTNNRLENFVLGGSALNES